MYSNTVSMHTMINLTLDPPLNLEYQSLILLSFRQGMLGKPALCTSGNTHDSPSPVILQKTYIASSFIPKLGSIQYHPKYN